VNFGIRFGPAIVVGPAFRPWGCGTVGFAWGTHAIMTANRFHALLAQAGEGASVLTDAERLLLSEWLLRLT
jgi:hypothetical protein